jgi:hypothetical protein
MPGHQVPERDDIRNRLEDTRREYHDLLSAISEDVWTGKSGNPDMTVKELMWHIAWSMRWMSGSVDAVRRGRNAKVPSFLLEPARKLAMRWLARSATKGKASQAYDSGHDALLAKIGTIPIEDWSLSAMRFGERRSVGWYFTHAPEHFEEHARDVRAVLKKVGAV